MRSVCRNAGAPKVNLNSELNSETVPGQQQASCKGKEKPRYSVCMRTGGSVPCLYRCSSIIVICCDKIENRMNFTRRHTHRVATRYQINAIASNIVNAVQCTPIGSPDLHITVLLYALRARHDRLVEPQRHKLGKAFDRVTPSPFTDACCGRRRVSSHHQAEIQDV